MNIRTFLKCTFLVAGLLCATSYQAAAQAQRGGGGMGGGGVLTQEQRTKMNEATREDMTSLREKLVEAQKDAVKAALDNASEATLKAKLEAVSKIQTEMALVRAKAFKSIASSLTAEQKSQLESARDGGYGQVFGMMGKGGWHPWRQRKDDDYAKNICTVVSRSLCNSVVGRVCGGDADDWHVVCGYERPSRSGRCQWHVEGWNSKSDRDHRYRYRGC